MGERTVLLQAPDYRTACARLPERSPASVRDQWVRLHGTTKHPFQYRAPNAPHPLTGRQGRPPQTADERRVGNVLWHIRERARAAQVPVDAGVILAALRETDWRRFTMPEILQALPLEGWGP